MEKKTVCYCKMVSEKTIRKAIENGADTLEAVKEATGAATACGRCKGTIEKILADMK